MRKLTCFLVLAAICLFSGESILAQKTTEQFIPLGKSPGVSNITTWIGVIEAIDAQNRAITVKVGDRSKTIGLTDETKIYLDRSKVKLKNLLGKFTDLSKGLKVEIKYFKDRENQAEWIKAEITE